MTYDPQASLVGTIADGDPTSSNDSTQGFRYGSVWINRVSLRAFVCSDPGVGGAVWGELGALTDLVSEFVKLRNDFRQLLLVLVGEGFDLPDGLVEEADQAEPGSAVT